MTGKLAGNYGEAVPVKILQLVLLCARVQQARKLHFNVELIREGILLCNVTMLVTMLIDTYLFM